jgi:hypothetical protein
MHGDTSSQCILVLSVRENGYLIPTDLTCFCLLTGYMTARVWSMTVRPRRTSWQNSIDSDGVRTMERLEIVWVARSASVGE